MGELLALLFAGYLLLELGLDLPVAIVIGLTLFGAGKAVK